MQKLKHLGLILKVLGLEFWEVGFQILSGDGALHPAPSLCIVCFWVLHFLTLYTVIGKESLEEHGIICYMRRITLILTLYHGFSLLNSPMDLIQPSSARTTRIRIAFSYSFYDMTITADTITRVQHEAFFSLPSQLRRFEVRTFVNYLHWIRFFHRTYSNTYDPLDISQRWSLRPPEMNTSFK